MSQQPNSDLSRLVVHVSRLHTVRHTTTGVTPLKSDQLIAEAATYVTHNKHNRRTSIPSEGFEPPIPAIKQPQTYAVDHTATAICSNSLWRCMLRYISLFSYRNQTSAKDRACRVTSVIAINQSATCFDTDAPFSRSSKQ